MNSYDVARKSFISEPIFILGKLFPVLLIKVYKSIITNN